MLSWKFKINFYYKRFKNSDSPRYYNRCNLPECYFKLGVIDYLDENPDCIGVALKQDNGMLMITDVDREIKSWELEAVERYPILSEIL